MITDELLITQPERLNVTHPYRRCAQAVVEWVAPDVLAIEQADLAGDAAAGEEQQPGAAASLAEQLSPRAEPDVDAVGGDRGQRDPDGALPAFAGNGQAPVSALRAEVVDGCR
jgi:hypothetical protein